MDIISYIILGIVQGLTEFLPVSSSGHLELGKALLGDQSVGEESLLTTVVLHFATALATVVVFRKEIMRIVQGLFQPQGSEERRFAVKIIISMIPATVVGLMLEEWIDDFFGGKILLVCSMLILTSGLLYWSDRAVSKNQGLSFSDSFWIGIAQAIAILPGISRSGATISTALLLGVKREEAASFSFLMVVPLIFGKMAKDLLFGDFSGSVAEPLGLGLGFLSAFLVGLAACTWMIKLIKGKSLRYFALYCLVVGVLGIGYTLLS